MKLRHILCVGLSLSLSTSVFEAQAQDKSPPAIAYGQGGCGRLTGGQALPCRSDNFQAFADTACLLGRNYVHPLLAQTLIDAYARLRKTHPRRDWQYGDLGWKQGGKFAPHRTHQNGLSADFFTPVIDEHKKPTLLPIKITNTFGYGIEFDRRGRFEKFEIDWKAMADHLVVLKKAGQIHGVKIKRVILDPKLQTIFLKEAPKAKAFRRLFNKRQAWVRHDEHYHIDFEIPKLLRRSMSCRKR